MLLKIKFSSDVLDNISFNIQEGEKIAIIGESGSGKSTLLKLLSGFYKPSSGEILFDKQLIDKFDIESFREKLELFYRRIDYLVVRLGKI